MSDGPNIADNAAMIAAICAEWDLAEADMKRAEQIGKALVMPSVNELRYAGRRLVDAWTALTRTDCDNSEVCSLLRDAKFFCLRARHDAIDCSISAMVNDVENMLEHIGYLIIAQCYSDLPKFQLSLKKIQDNIVQSRANRQNRDLIYKTVSECDFPVLMDLHARLMVSEPAMLQVAEAKKVADQAAVDAARRDSWKNNLFGYGGWVLAVVGFVLAIAAWKYPHFWEATSRL